MTDCDKCKEYDKEKNYCPVFCNVINDTLTDRAIEELEKIKTEVCEPNEMEYFENSNVWQKWFCDLIDNHISELKGENNE